MNVIEIRRKIHQNPELSFKEFNTSQFIVDRLLEAGLDVERIETGVVGIYRG